MDHIPRLSEAVYVGMCRIAGTPIQVSIRRSTLESIDKAFLPFHEKFGTQTMISGSRREGFHFKGSDWDFMSWPCDHNVLWDVNQAIHYNIIKSTLILMENIEDRPGFVFLQLMTSSNLDEIHRSCVIRKNRSYISSSLYRENRLQHLSIHPIIHGPCATGNIGGFEFDAAYCFRSLHWPTVADQFVDRCRARGWPANDVLEDIISAGCHVVPIGLKGSPQEDMEWRMSFSLAEQKLVHSMTHTQFLCYGLLKLFLKEALDVKDVNGQSLLCSYFMKTVLFWVIQSHSTMDWSPPNLLPGFWLCFKGLLSNVQRGYLPNFFIPENNMFQTKICGHSQELLHSRLLELYNIGIASLLHCPSVRDFFMKAILHKEHVVRNEETDSPSTMLLELLKEVDMARIYLRKICSTIESCTTLLGFYGNLDILPASPFSWFNLLTFFTDGVRYLANILFKLSANNKRRVQICQSCEALLKISVRVGCLSDRIYLALFYCISGENQKAFPILEKLRRDITQPGIIQNDGIYLLAFSSMVEVPSLADKRKYAATLIIHIHDDDMIVKELKLEQKANGELLRIPPYIMTLFLLIVCNHGNLQTQQEVLHELYFIVNFDDGHYVCKHLRDISWQILGICQQICGDHQGALLSYEKSLKEEAFHEIQEATYRRIQDARSKI